MHLKCVFKHFLHHHRPHFPTLILLWFAGLSVGTVLSVTNKCTVTTLITIAFSTTPSPVYLFIINILPIVTIAFFLTMQLHTLVNLSVLFLSIFHSFSAAGIILSHGSSAWLLAPLFLFSANSTAVIMWWLLIRHRCANTPRFPSDIRTACIISCFIAAADHWLILPFLNDLTKYF